MKGDLKFFYSFTLKPLFMKKFLTRIGQPLLAVLLFNFNATSQTKIDPETVSLNYWFVNPTGSSGPTDFTQTTWNKVKQTGIKYIRFGGTAVNFGFGVTKTMLSPVNYKDVVLRIRDKGAEPILQVPFSGKTDPALVRGEAAAAADLVDFINIRNNLNVKYWIISNEPDLAFNWGDNSTPAHAENIARYITAFAAAMKNVDPNIQIIGPELAGFNTSVAPFTSLFSRLISDPLTNPATSIAGRITDPNNKARGKFFVDIVSFHSYVQDDSYHFGAPTNLGFSRYSEKLTMYLDELKGYVTTARRTSLNLKMAITELNYAFPNTALNSDQLSKVEIEGTETNSFIAGQLLADLGCTMLLHSNGVNPDVKFFNFWSTREGCDDSGSSECNNTDVGLLHHASEFKKPSYWHFKMLRDYFSSGEIYKGTTANNNYPVKAYAAKEGHRITVMVFNESSSATTYSIRLDNTYAASGTTQVKFENLGLNKEVVGNVSISYPELPAHSTSLFIFDCNGDLSSIYSYTQAAAASVAFDALTKPTPSEDAGPALIYTSPLALIPQVSVADVTVGINCPGTLTVNPQVNGASYQWYVYAKAPVIESDNGKPRSALASLSAMVYTYRFVEIPNETNPSYTTRKNGTYQVAVTLGDCKATAIGKIKYRRDIACLDPIGTGRGFTAISCANTGGSNPREISGTLSQSTMLANDTTWVPDSLVIPSGVTLNLTNQVMVLSPDAVIQVQQGGSLRAENSVFQGCDLNTWGGIEALGNNTQAGQLILTACSVFNSVSPISADQVTGLVLTGNTFVNGATAVELSGSRDFTILNNEFENFTHAVLTSGSLPGTSAVISDNTFENIERVIGFANDNHANLSIACNTFSNYLDYAIYSDNTTLSNQGSALSGAGNTFITASALVNHQLLHNGPAMTYYYDPQNPVSLVTGNGLTASSTAAAANSGCSLISSRKGSSATAQALLHQELNSLGDAVPNPSSGKVQLSYTLGSTAGNAEIRVLNIFGLEMRRLPLNKDLTTAETDLSGLPDGIYFYSLICDGGVVSTKRLVLSK
jgi:hypothetical protein